MQVVYTPTHLGHDITLETFMGVSVLFAPSTVSTA